MQHLKLLSVFVIAIGFLGFPQISQAHLDIDCDSSFVKPHATQLMITVLPNGVDDTVNIQCALDEAIRTGVPIVRLAKGDFAISRIFAKNFKGSFQGTTRTDTRLEILDDSIDCSIFSTETRMSAAIKFDSGEPKLKYMTISSNSPCLADVKMRAIVHFTGDHAYEPSCRNDVILATVDRVDMVGPGMRADSDQAAIQASAEGMHWSTSCKKNLLGTFKVNQSSVTGYEVGVLTSMKSGAQVDINFSDFSNNGTGLDVIDSNQSTTVTGNTFTSENDDLAISGLAAIRIRSRRDPVPPKTRVVIHNNQFMITDRRDVLNNHHRGSVVATHFSADVQDISLSVTDNRFQVVGAHLFIIDIREIDDWVVSGNLFSGNPGSGVLALNFKDPSITGGVIIANSFKNLHSDANDIYLDETSTECIVGPGQDATVRDDGIGNTVL